MSSKVSGLPKFSDDITLYNRLYMRQYIKEHRIHCATCKRDIGKGKLKAHLLTQVHIRHAN